MQSVIERRRLAYGLHGPSAPLVLIAIVVMSCMAAIPARAGDGVWTSNGPDGGYVYDVAFDPTTEGRVWVATASGVYVTDGAGETWARVTGTAPNDLPRMLAHRVAVDPTGKVYVGAAGGDVYRSEDGGRTWLVQISRPQFLNSFNDMVIDLLPPYSTLYAGNWNGVYRSDDGGENWVEASGVLPNVLPGEVRDLVLEAGTLYAATERIGVWKTPDGGFNWYPANGINPATLPTTNIRAMTTNSAGTLFVATIGEGVWRSEDGGDSWQPANGAPPSELPAEVLDPYFGVEALATDAAGSLYLGGHSNIVYKGESGGASWSAVTLPVEPAIIRAFAFDPIVTERVIAGLDAGIARSDDAGATWTPKNDGFRAFRVWDLHVDAGAPETLFAGEISGISRSTDSGETWEDISAGLASRFIYDLAVCPSSATLEWPRLYTNNYSAGDLFRHDGGGGPFFGSMVDKTPFGPEGPAPIAVAADTNDPDRVLVGHLGGTAFGDMAGLFLSEDGGATFSRIYEPPPELNGLFQSVDIVIDPIDPDRIYASAIGIDVAWRFAWHVIRSEDGGATFEEVLSGAGLAWVEFALAANDPIEGGGASTAYLYTFSAHNGAVPMTRRSDDGGATWTDLDAAPARSRPLRADPIYPGTVYSYGYYDLLVSRDRGDSWEVIPTDEIADIMFAGVDVSTTTPPTIHVGTVAGVYSYTTLGPQVALPRDAGTGAQPATLSFDNVIASGETTLAMSETGPREPSGFKLGDPATYYDLETTAVFAGQVEVCITYDPASFQSPENELALYHYEDGAWVDVTSSHDTRNDTICGLTTSLSPFIIIEPDADDDEVADAVDWCAATAMPEGVPTKELGTNRWALLDADHAFDTNPSGGSGSSKAFTTVDTGGCSCEQIIVEQGLGEGHKKHGCSTGELREWSAIVHGG